jgi:hypothetical protein
MLMKTRWILPASLMLLTLTNLVSCRPGAPLAAEDAGEARSTQVPMAGGLTQAQAGITPTWITTEEDAMNGTQVPAKFDDEAAESVKSARQDLARKLGMAADDITVMAVIGEEFSTNAFYCRTAKERTAREDPPAVISGFTILLKASGRRYEYHASGQTVIFCRPLS